MYKRQSLHTSKYSDDILQIEQYVNDKSSLNKQCLSFADSQPMTVITKRNKELARNKPIIIGIVQNTKAKIFLDTGADINLVDKTFIFQHLLKCGKMIFDQHFHQLNVLMGEI